MSPKSSEYAVQEPLQAKPKRQRSVLPHGYDSSYYELEDGSQCKTVKDDRSRRNRGHWVLGANLGPSGLEPQQDSLNT